jgi:uncharacterized protein YxjI
MPPGDLQKAKVDAMYLIRERLFGFGDDAEITDENGGPVLQVDGKMLSLRDRLVLRDPDGREVAQVQRRLAAMRPTYQISVAGEQVAKVRKQLFTPFVDRYTIDIPGRTIWRWSGISSTTSTRCAEAGRWWRPPPRRSSASATPTPST